MQYLLLIYSDETHWQRISDAERQSVMAEYNAFTQSLKDSGHYKAGQALQPTATARTVRTRDGQVLSTDGPFAETKEQLGGFYWVDAKDADEAAALAARIPSARVGCIEVRPIWPTTAG
jgi:hypothetical protein